MPVDDEGMAAALESLDLNAQELASLARLVAPLVGFEPDAESPLVHGPRPDGDLTPLRREGASVLRPLLVAAGGNHDAA